MTTEIQDAIIVGGGPAGLSAAMWLGRYQRSVLLFDAGEPRNEPAWAVHGYPGIVDPSPLELRRRLQQQGIGGGRVLEPGIEQRIEHADAQQAQCQHNLPVGEDGAPFAPQRHGPRAVPRAAVDGGRALPPGRRNDRNRVHT